jgi:23S rRNA (cytidine2498-2'-O)-methyltransferase
MNGRDLAEAYFVEIVEPLLADLDLRYGAALIGPGSEVLGFDTAMSADHDFGPRVLLFLDEHERGSGRDAVRDRLERGLPDTFRGFPTRFVLTHDAPHQAPPHRVIVTDAASWQRTALGVTTDHDLAADVWLGIPWQLLCEATAGAVFRDDLSRLARMRDALAWYPDDIWRYVLAAQWHRVAQEEPFVGRTGHVRDDLGSTVLAARLVRDLMRLAMLLHRRYPPYAKWLGTAFATLPDRPPLEPALRADDWPAREAALGAAYEHLARAQNALGLCAPVDPTCRPFWDRPFRVLDADRFTGALLAAITDPAVRRLPTIGNVDQFVDNTDVLRDAARSQAVTQALLAPAPEPSGHAEARPMIDRVRVLVSMSDESYDLAIGELRGAFGAHLDVRRESGDLASLGGVTAREVAERCAALPLVFPRHVTTEVARLRDPDVDAVAGAAQSAVRTKEIAVQVWASGPPSFGFGPADAARAITGRLREHGYAVARAGVPWVLSCCLTEDTALLGVNRAADSLADWPGGRVRLAQRKEQVSRSEFKLEELLQVHPLDIPARGRAVDFGAAPGGWTRILRTLGVEVWAVDPGELDPRVGADRRVHYVRSTAGEFLRRDRSAFDIAVNDMRMDPLTSCRLMLDAAPHLRPGGLAVVTLKTGTRNVADTVRASLRTLERAYRVEFARQLHHNRHEVTVVATLR